MCKDYIVRATAADGQIRAFAATMRDTVETARKAHNTSPVATAALGRLLTAGAIAAGLLVPEPAVEGFLHLAGYSAVSGCVGFLAQQARQLRNQA